MGKVHLKLLSLWIPRSALKPGHIYHANLTPSDKNTSEKNPSHLPGELCFKYARYLYFFVIYKDSMVLLLIRESSKQ